jgi:putative hydrolase of the HAD superfamily
VSMEELGKAMSKAEADSGEHPLAELECGRITEAEFARRLEANLDGRFDLERLRTLYFEHLDPNRPMVELMRELRGRGLRTALLTNNVREWEPLWRSKLPELDEIFEVVVDSAFVGMRKPQPEIYELTLDRMGGLPAHECVFVDDLEPNCETARKLGMRVVRFESNEQALPELKAVLG